MLKFALFGNVYQHEKSGSIRLLLDTLRRHDATIFIDKEYSDFLRQQGILEPAECAAFTEFTEFADIATCDFALSMGGDGTLLKTASRVGARQTPIIGVNMGRLGFLADVSPADIEKSIDAIYREDYSVEDRALIRVETNGEPIDGCPCALNDVAILKRDTASMISIRAKVNGEYLTTYQADGLVVSTPTGSTAYSLSNGGPIIIPQTRVFLMTAVAPHSLNTRPLVIPETATLDIDVESRTHNYLVAIDGRSESLPETTRLSLHLAPYKAQIVKRPRQSHFQTLREKMMWGADVRD